MTLEAFLGWEERQELRYEFDDFQPVAMTGGTFTRRDPAQPDQAVGNRLSGDDWVGHVVLGDAVLAMPGVGINGCCRPLRGCVVR